MSTYYCLQETIHAGDKVLRFLEAIPLGDIPSVEPNRRQLIIEAYREVLSEQLGRLKLLINLVQKNSVLDLFDRDLRSDLEKVIGESGSTKAKIARALVGESHGLAPSTELLKLYTVDLRGSDEKGSMLQIILLRLIANRDAKELDVHNVETNLGELKKAAERLRLRIREIATNEEIIELEQEAKRRGKLRSMPGS